MTLTPQNAATAVVRVPHAHMTQSSVLVRTRARRASQPPQHPQANFHFWWFVTRRCNNHCPHCLRYDIGDVGEELNATQARRLLLEWTDWLRRNRKTASLAFGGANPICREDLPNLLEICRQAIEEKLFAPEIGILANPQGIDLAYAKMMRRCGIRRFTLSLDGLRETNDAMRGPGNFDAAVACMDILAEAGIERDIKFTCIKRTQKEFPQVVALAKEHGITRVMPGRLILEGGGKAMADEALSDEEWSAFLKENGLPDPPYVPLPKPDAFGTNASTENGGLAAGTGEKLKSNNNRHFVIMAGGEFRPNRRGPALGHWPEESFDSLMDKLARFVPPEGCDWPGRRMPS